MLWYWIAYFAVTTVGILHTIYNAKVRGMGVMGKGQQSMKDIESYAKTMPFHSLYNIIIFPIFAAIYLNGLVNLIADGFYTGLIWFDITAAFDLIGWVRLPD